MKSLKTFVALLLVSVLALMPLLSVGAAAKTTNVRDIPEIHVTGFVASDIFVDKDDPSKGYIWEWSQDEIIDFVKSLLPPIVKYFMLSDWDGMADAIIPLALDFFDGVIPNPDGSAPGNTGVDFTYPAPNQISRSSHLDFHYDWRMDPVEVAAELNDFIDYVLECAGTDQVTLSCHSLGGVITTAYVSIYGDAKLRSVVYNTTAIYGETYTGELLSGQMVLNADAVQAYLEFAFEGNEYETLLNGIIKAINDMGLLDFVCQFGNIALEKLSPKVLPAVVVPLFAGMPAIWAMVPDEYMESSMDYVFNTIYKDDPVDRSGLIEKIENYNTLVREHKTETLQKLNEDANFYVFSRYGYSSIPIVPSYTSLSDSVIDTKYSSFGATTAEYGQTLSEEVLENADPKYVSPDKLVYAGSCMFPDQTWFFKNFPHATNAPLDEMITTLLYTDTQATVETYPEYPQFMKFDRETRTVSPLTATEAAQSVSFWQKVQNFFTTLIDRLLLLFEQLTKLIADAKSIGA